MYFGLKKSSTDHSQSHHYSESEFEKVLKKKENLQKSTSIEQRIETINKAEQQINLKLYNNTEKKDLNMESDEFSKVRFTPEKSVKLFASDNEIEKKDPRSRSENKVQPENRKNKGKIKAYRNSRSLVTVDKGKDNLLFQTIEKMEFEGMTVNEIAKKLGRGVREIEIIKRLNEKS